MSSQVGTLLSGRYRLDAQIGAGGHVDGLSRLRHGARAPGRDQAHAPRDRRGLRPARALPARGARRRAAQPPAHRRRHRRRRGAPPEEPTGFGEPVAMPYIVFEYVEGETLKDRIRRMGRLPIPEAVAYAIEIARALEAAHERRIVHRDVKPQNVLIDEEGTAQGHRLRDRAHADRGGPDGRRPRARHDRLRLARAGARPRRRPAVRPLLARHRAVRDAHRRRAVPRARTRSPWR